VRDGGAFETQIEGSNLDQWQKRCTKSITKMDDGQALDFIAQLVDDSFDRRSERGANRALYLLSELVKRPLREEDGVLVEYFRANAWAALSHIANTNQSWSWEDPKRQEELLALSRALSHRGFRFLEPLRRCQILTNHANLLDTLGRTFEAIAGWNSALKIMPNFGMALGNRGLGLKTLASLTVDDRQRAILVLHAHDSLRLTMTDNAFFEEIDPSAVFELFTNAAIKISKAANVDAIRGLQRLDQGRESRSRAENKYRLWCLHNQLFLCPLNELGPHLAAATDDLVLPSLTEGFNGRPDGYLPPPIIGLFNQMKQEYAAARYTLFEGMTSTKVHFSDLGVTLVDTLDYPLYSLASERVRIAFRIAYSLLDKVAFLVNKYWELNKAVDRINFKNVWMVEGKARLLPQFEACENLPLRGLFWLSKEIFDDELKAITASDARELHAIRNALEHTYLNVSEGWAKALTKRDSCSTDFGIAIGSDELEAKALRVLKMARSAMFYTSFAIGIEERKKRSADPSAPTFSMPLNKLENSRKRRDPISG
jgi:LA2681-like HEPN